MPPQSEIDARAELENLWHEGIVEVRKFNAATLITQFSPEVFFPAWGVLLGKLKEFLVERIRFNKTEKKVPTVFGLEIGRAHV